MIRFFVGFLTSFFITIVQTTITSWFFPAPWKPDLMILFVIYVGLSFPLYAGALLVAFCGFFYDTFSGSPWGLFLFVYLSLFFFLRLLGKILILGETLALRMGLVSLSILLQALLLIFLPWVLGISGNFSGARILWIPPTILTTSLFCWPFFYLFKKLDISPEGETIESKI
jgi:rod shape-determining protein MreD